MEGTCNECVFPLDEEHGKIRDQCPSCTSFIYAAVNGKLSCLKELIAAGADVNHVCKCHGTGALISAVMGGHIDCLKELIQSGAEVNIQNPKEETMPLVAAANEGQTECLQELLAAGADVQKQDGHGKTALMLAAWKGHFECVKQLIDGGVNVDIVDNKGNTSLVLAAENGNAFCARELIAAGADVNASNMKGLTSLMLAARYGHIKCVKELIAAGADVKLTNKNGFNSLIMAAQNGHTERVRELISAGAQVNKQYQWGPTALWLASYKGHSACIKELVTAGADVNRSFTTRPLTTAIKAENEYSLEDLLKAGADVNSIDGVDGNTPLMTAVGVNNKTIVQLLIDWGANINAENNKGETALYLAVTKAHADFQRQQTNNHQIVYILLLAGAHLHKTSSGLDPCTVHADKAKFTKTNPHILKMLSAGGANIVDKENFSSVKQLQNSSKDCIRGHLKQIHPEKNLYVTIPQLGLPTRLQSDLLFYTLQNPQIPKLLCPVDANNVEEEKVSSIQQLQDCSKDCIREHLKQIHPEKSLYVTVSQLGLPTRSQYDLFFHILQKNNQILKNNEVQLILKAFEGDIESAQSLIGAGAAVNSQDEEGMTALMIASKNGYLEMVEQLVKEGAGLNLQTLFGDTALIYVTRKNQNDCVQKLLEYGAEINTQDKDGNTALIHAAKVAHNECLHTLNETGANPNIQNNDGSTALILGITCLNAVVELLKAGAGVNHVDREGNTALIRASILGQVDCVKKLIEYGADVNGDGCHTALMESARHGRVNCLELLIQKGADLNLIDEYGCTALRMAAPNYFEECFKTLFKAGADVEFQTAANMRSFFDKRIPSQKGSGN